MRWRAAARIAWQGRGGRAVVHLTKDDLVLGDKEPSLKLTRAQETELPQQVEVGFTEGETDYRRAAVASRRLSGASRREARADSAVVTRRAEAQRLADTWLQDLWAGREGAEFELSPRRIELEPGDVIAVPTDAGEKLHRIVRIADGATRKVTHARGGAGRVRAAGLLHPASGEAPAAGARQAAGGRARSAGWPSAIPPPCNIWRSRPIPGRAP